MDKKNSSIGYKVLVIGMLASCLGLSVLKVEGWANMNLFQFAESERMVTQQPDSEERSVTILKPASSSSSPSPVRTSPSLSAAEKKRLAVLLIFLGAVAEEET